MRSTIVTTFLALLSLACASPKRRATDDATTIYDEGLHARQTPDSCGTTTLSLDTPQTVVVVAGDNTYTVDPPESRQQVEVMIEVVVYDYGGTYETTTSMMTMTTDVPVCPG